MRPADSHLVARARQVILALCISLSLSAQSDRDMLDAYKQEDMSVWKTYIDTITNHQSPITNRTLAYEYGYCGYIVSKDKEAAKPYVARFIAHVESLKEQLPAGHYEMYMSAVYVYELRLHESIHPIKAMSLAKDAVKIAPEDPIVLSYYGTCLFYAPKPFGSKKEALEWFERAETLFQDPQYRYSWLREANTMYINQCKEKTMATIYDFSALSNRGKEVNLADYKGQVILIVNTASKCGFTPQYDGLEELYKKYKDQGFVILGFPCDQFANQEPGSDEQIEEFCRLNHGVTFPLMAKSDVNGANANPVFEFLKAQAPTEEYNGLKAKAAHAMLKRISKSVEKDSDILWNFTKFLISKDGKTIKRYAPTTEPKDFEKDIEIRLNE